MLRVTFGQEKNYSYKVLCLGAHSDDIEIGCGGTILQLVKNYPGIEFHWVVFSANKQRAQEAQYGAKTFLSGVERKTVVIRDFRDGFFPYVGADVKEYFEKIKMEFTPNLIFTHYRHDLHQDHRLISELTWNTFRDHLILEYEITKFDGDLGTPNFFVHLSKNECQQKIDKIVNSFKTQTENHWFTEETFRSILRLRGVESNAPDGYAESFYCRKLVLS